MAAFLCMYKIEHRMQICLRNPMYDEKNNVPVCLELGLAPLKGQQREMVFWLLQSHLEQKYKFFHAVPLGLGTEFRSEKIPRNRLGMISVIPRKKVLIPRHSDFRGRASSEARNGTKSC